MTDTTDPLPFGGIAPQRWRCCQCGGTGLDSHGQTCDTCEGLGFC